MTTGPDDVTLVAPAAPSGTARRVVATTLWQSAGRVVAIVLTGLAVAATTRYLSPEDYGVYVTATSFVTLLAVLVDGGLVTIAVREIAKRPGDEALVFGQVLALRLLLAVVATGVAVGLSYLLYGGRAPVRQAVAIVSGTLLLSAVAGAYRVVGEARLKVLRIVVAEVVARAVALGALLLVIRSDNGLHGVLWTVVVASAAGAVTVALAYGRDVRPLPRLRREAAWPLLRASLPLGLAFVINAVYFRVDSIILSVQRPAAEVGYYGLAYRVLELVLSFGAFYLAAVFPVLSASAGDPERLRRVAQRSFQLLFAAGLVVTVCGVVVAGDLVRLLAGGGDFAPAGKVLAILVATALLSWVNGCGGMLLVAVDRQRDCLWLNVGSLALNVTANLLLVPRYGYLAAAWVTVGSEVVQFAGMVYLVRRYTGIAFRVEAWPRIVALALVAGGATALLRSAGLAVVLVVPLVGAAWAGAMVAFRIVPSPAALLRPEG